MLYNLLDDCSEHCLAPRVCSQRIAQETSNPFLDPFFDLVLEDAENVLL
jgi:hypothetical protein